MSSQRAEETQFFEFARNWLWRFPEGPRDEVQGGAELTPKMINRLIDDAKKEGILVSPRELAGLLRLVRNRVAHGRIRASNALLNLPPDLEYLIGPSEIAFLERFLSNHPRMRVLDPWAGLGSMALALESALSRETEYTLFAPAPAIPWLDRFAKHMHARVVPGDFLAMIGDPGGPFDLIVCAPPMGVRVRNQYEGLAQQYGIRGDFGELLLLHAGQLLADNGLGAFVMPASFVRSDIRRGAYQGLRTAGLKIEAFLSIPRSLMGAFGINRYLVLFSRGEQDKVFVGELAEDSRRTDELLSNYRNRRDGPELALGRLVDLSEFKGYASLEYGERLERELQRLNMPVTELGPLIREINRGSRRAEETLPARQNAIYFPMIIGGEVQTLPPSNVSQYWQVVLDDTRVIADYAAIALNSEVGRLALQAAAVGSMANRLLRDGIHTIKLPLPDLPAQADFLKVESRISELSTELGDLREELRKDPSRAHSVASRLQRFNRDRNASFREWLDTLPFPLASVLWCYHSQAGDLRRQYEHLDHFFEAAAEFIAIIFLSAYRQMPEILDQIKATIAPVLLEQHLSLNRSTYGLWVTILGHLAKHSRSLLNGKPEDKAVVETLFRTTSSPLLSGIVSKDVVRVLQDVNGLRNDWRGHGGIVSDETASERLRRLEAHLLDFRIALGPAWDRYNLVLPGPLRHSHGQFRYDTMRLVGPTTPFPHWEITTKEPLEDGCLHFVDSIDKTALCLLPFVKVLGAPSSAQNACYFYNRLELGDRVRLISYHYDTEAERIDSFPDIAKLLRMFDNDSRQ